MSDSQLYLDFDNMVLVPTLEELHSRYRNLTAYVKITSVVYNDTLYVIQCYYSSEGTSVFPETDEIKRVALELLGE